MKQPKISPVLDRLRYTEQNYKRITQIVDACWGRHITVREAIALLEMEEQWTSSESQPRTSQT
jgi:hypothetical protein